MLDSPENRRFRAKNDENTKAEKRAKRALFRSGNHRIRCRIGPCFFLKIPFSRD